MLVVVPERKNSNIFLTGYLGSRELSDLEFSRKITISSFFSRLSGLVFDAHPKIIL